MSEPGTNAGDLFLGAGAHQFLGRGWNPHYLAATGADPVILSEGLAASVAIHIVPPLPWIRRWQRKCSFRIASHSESSNLPYFPALYCSSLTCSIHAVLLFLNGDVR